LCELTHEPHVFLNAAAGYVKKIAFPPPDFVPVIKTRDDTWLDGAERLLHPRLLAFVAFPQVVTIIWHMWFSAPVIFDLTVRSSTIPYGTSGVVKKVLLNRTAELLEQVAYVT
jgi:hypothetical protein